jgi:hypothetical protein
MRTFLYCTCLAIAVAGQPILAQPEEEEREAKAWVACISDPPGAKILVGHPQSQESWEKGTTPTRVPVYDLGPTPRELRFTFTKPGYEPYTSLVTVTPGDEIRLVARLEPRRYLAYVSDEKLVMANADGSTPTEVAQLEQPLSWEAPVWLGEAEAVAVWEAGALVVYGPEGEELETLVTPASAARAVGTQQPVALWRAAPLASGRGAVCLGTWGAGETAALVCPRDAGDSPTVLAPGALRVSASPTEDVVAVTAGAGTTVYRLRGSGEVDILSELPGVEELVWSPDGGQIAVALKDELYIGDAGFEKLIQVTASGQAGPEHLLWHPSGDGVLCTIHRHLTARSRWDEIWLVHAPGVEGDPMLLVDGRGHPHSSTLAPLAFVPYSGTLAYRVGNPPDHRTYLVDFGEPGSNEVLLFNSGLPAWSEAVAGTRSRPPRDTGETEEDES